MSDWDSIPGDVQSIIFETIFDKLLGERDGRSYLACAQVNSRWNDEFGKRSVRESVYLSDVSDDELYSVSRMLTVDHLSVSYVKDSKKTFEIIAGGFPGLQSLAVTSKNMCDEALLVISDMESLTDLELHLGNYASHWVMMKVVALPNLRTIKVWTFWCTFCVSRDRGVTDLISRDFLERSRTFLHYKPPMVHFGGFEEQDVVDEFEYPHHLQEW